MLEIAREFEEKFDSIRGISVTDREEVWNELVKKKRERIIQELSPEAKELEAMQSARFVVENYVKHSEGSKNGEDAIKSQEIWKALSVLEAAVAYDYDGTILKAVRECQPAELEIFLRTGISTYGDFLRKCRLAPNQLDMKLISSISQGPRSGQQRTVTRAVSNPPPPLRALVRTTAPLQSRVNTTRKFPNPPPVRIPRLPSSLHHRRNEGKVQKMLVKIIGMGGRRRVFGVRRKHSGRG